MSSPLQSVEIHFDPAGFGERLQKARKASGLTQEGLAEKLAVDRNHVSRMERGTRVCSIDLLVEIAVALDVSTDYLLMGRRDTGMVKRDIADAIEKLAEIHPLRGLLHPRPEVVRAAGGPHRQVWPYAATLPEGTPARPLQQLDFERKAVPSPIRD